MKRKKLYELVHNPDENLSSKIYKYLMILFIVVSIFPLMFKERNEIFVITDSICIFVFLVDYVLRWITADYRLKCDKGSAFLRYPFRFISLIDLMSVLALFCSVFYEDEGLRFAGVLAVFRIIRIFRYSKSVSEIAKVLKKSEKSLRAVGGLAIGYILLSAIIIYNVEPASFDTFFDAVYWATVSLTTVGYGDIYPVTVLGRIVAMTSSFFGIAIVALPAGIVTAEYINQLKEKY